jgi:hypothetical protein
LKRNYLNQKERLLLNIVSIALLFVANYLIFGTYTPTFDNKSLWFLVALLNIFLANQLFSPFFVKPIDSISFGVTALTSVVMIRPEATWSIYSQVLFYTCLAYSAVIILLSIVCILLKDSKVESRQTLSDQLKTILAVIGSANTVFTLVLFFALITYHYPSAKEILGILLVYIFLVVQSPLQATYLLVLRVLARNSMAKRVLDSGEVVAHQEPNIVLVRQDTEAEIPYLTCMIVKDTYSSPKLGYSLDYVGKSDGVLLRTFIVEKTKDKEIIADTASLSPNSVLFVEKQYFEQHKIPSPNPEMIGLVSQESSIDYLSFEIIVDEGIQVGTLVTTSVQKKMVVYQVVNGVTREEIVQKKNTFGYINVTARKVGEWIETEKHFVPSTWVPRMNAEVLRLPQATKSTENEHSIGRFPQSDYSVNIADMNSLVTHNTAILGILGIGKSMLAIELIERMVATGIKVVCLDLTNQYQIELSDFLDSQYEATSVAKIQAAGQRDRDVWAENPEDGGSIKHFVAALHDDLEEFLENEAGRKLKIYNPSQLFATRQRDEPKQYKVGQVWKRSANVHGITAVEATQIVSESILDLVSTEMTDQAKVCLVLEEAHSLVPEFGSVVNDSDKYATNGTARAILQGRKYGFGCVLVTQRTANVTKTILNQCNNIFAMRTFDDTGKAFLSNYIGADYTQVLSAIPARHAVFFGKASSCENPVLLRLNDREDFLRTFRAVFPCQPIMKTEADPAEFEDDMP